MKKIFLLLAAFASVASFTAQAQRITVINKTKNRLGFIALNKPFTRSDASTASLIWLSSGQEKTITTNGRLLGWHCPGFAAGYTVIRRDDDTIAFVTHNGSIKSIHGTPINFSLENPYDEAYTFQTKNPYHGQEDCTKCAERCYDRDDTVAYCACLNWCWDKTLDRAWYLYPDDVVDIKIARGTKIGVYEDVDDYSCHDGECEKIIKVTTTRYY